MKLPATLRSLQYQNFQLFFGGQLISLVGTWMQTVAQAWLVYRLTHSAAELGGVGFVGQIPIFVLSPVAGIVADRFDRRQVVIATQTSSMLLAFALAALTLGHIAQVWHIYVLAGALGVASAFDIPARQSFFVEMVGRSDLMNAIALNSSMFNASRIVGPAIAGILVAAIGEGWCFFVNGVSFLAVIAGLVAMKMPPRDAEHPKDSPWRDLVEGFHFVVGNTAVHSILIMAGVISLTGMPYTTLMPIFADGVLHGGSKALGLLMGVSGLGALAGALTMASRESLKGLGRWIAVAATGLGAAMIAFAFSRVLWQSALLLVPVGYTMMIAAGSSNTLLQSMVPDRLRGRVMSVYSMMWVGMGPMGALFAGWAAERWGAPATVAGSGLICLGAAAVFWSQLERIRSHARQLIASLRER